MAYKILVVDDEDSVRRAIRRILESDNYEVAEAGNGLEALEWVRRSLPDLILLDLNMPKMGGLEFLQAARKINANLAVIMLTASVDEQEAAKTMELGASDYITKPVDVDYLLSSVQAKLALQGG
ncbi:MAG: response regulator [Elusimicrobiota bacterium]